MRSLIAMRAQRVRDQLAAVVPGVARAEVEFRRRSAVKEHWDLRALTLLPRRAGVAVDAGANIGIYSTVLSQRFETVWSFEPNPTLVTRLNALGLANTSIFPTALAAESLRSRLTIPLVNGRPTSGLGRLGAVEVPGRHFEIIGVSLDSLLPPPIALIKIDVEGFEESVLRGAAGVIDRYHPDLLVEIEERHNAGGVGRIVEMLTIHGYQGWFGFAGDLLPVADFDGAEHQELRDGRAADFDAYGHMFVFSLSPRSDLVQAAIRALKDVSR